MRKYIVIIALLLPFVTFSQPSITQGEFSTDNYKIVYEVAGTGYETIVIVHGLFADREQWRDLSRDLSEQGYQVITYDLPGYGESTTNTFETYEIARQVEALEELVQYLDLKNIHIAGHSMGGLIAAAYTLQNQENVESLAFLGAPLGLTPVKLSITEELWQMHEYPFTPTTLDEFDRLIKLLYTNKLDIRAEVIAAELTTYRENYMERVTINDTVKKYKHVLDNFPVSELPTLILWGEKENVFDVANAPDLQAKYKNSELIIIKDGSHMLHKENPDMVRDYFLGFLENISLSY